MRETMRGDSPGHGNTPPEAGRRLNRQACRRAGDALSWRARPFASVDEWCVDFVLPHSKNIGPEAWLEAVSTFRCHVYTQLEGATGGARPAGRISAHIRAAAPVARCALRSSFSLTVTMYEQVVQPAPWAAGRRVAFAPSITPFQTRIQGNVAIQLSAGRSRDRSGHDGCGSRPVPPRPSRSRRGSELADDP
jgi:hypothetical protein